MSKDVKVKLYLSLNEKEVKDALDAIEAVFFINKQAKIKVKNELLEKLYKLLLNNTDYES